MECSVGFLATLHRMHDGSRWETSGQFSFRGGCGWGRKGQSTATTMNAGCSHEID